MSYVATITNPADHWLFVPMPFPSDGFSVYLWTPETESGGTVPEIVKGVRSDAPEFQHATPAGPFPALLIPPHGSYRFSGRAGNRVEAWETSGTSRTPTSSSTRRAWPMPIAKVARDAGTFTVVVPPSTATASEPSA